MKRFLLIALLLLGILAACGPRQPGGRPSAQPAPTDLPPSRGPEPSPLQDIVVKQLAGNLGLETVRITVVSDARLTFADACLGVAVQGVTCAQVETPGHIIVLESGGLQYEYHANEDGSRIQPASIALTWKREGGIAGLCDQLTVFRSGEIYGNRCAPAAEGRMGALASLLSNGDRDRFQGWVQRFGRLSIDASDPKGVSDRMLVTLSFEGIGAQESVSSSEKQALLDFAASTYRQLFSQQPDR